MIDVAHPLYLQANLVQPLEWRHPSPQTSTATDFKNMQASRVPPTHHLHDAHCLLVNSLATFHASSTG